ncbi:DinB family protein [Lunatimonas salinarum]|uniref:DinB family protein n=1 Tax=Lunatimonas salinarum TaxID=1774590 RepID=UPI001ADFFADF|nr:DinB family protein [Lunatimonas salinarum]
MESMFKDLFGYTHKANQLVLTAMLEHREALPDKAFGLFNHIVNHSTYHRGQIATLFRESGLQPVVTDYIMLKRGN